MSNRKTTKKNSDKTEETPVGNKASAKLTSDATMNNKDNNEVMKAHSDMKTCITSKFEGVLNAIQEIKNEISEFRARLSEAGRLISETEDNVEKLEKKSECSGKSNNNAQLRSG